MLTRLIDAVIFDLDGTLVDSSPGIEYAVAAAWAAVQPGPPCPSLRSLIGPPIHEMLRQVLPDADAATLTALERAFRNAYDSDGWQKTVAYPGVLETLATLITEGVRCFGVTNKPTLPTQRILEHCGLRVYFQEFLSLDSRTPPFASKSEAVTELLTQYGLDPVRTLLMGDSVDDACVAQACGLRFAAFAGGYGWACQPIDLPVALVCTDFADVLQLIQTKAV